MPPIMFIAPETVPEYRPPMSMHAAHAGGITKSLKKLARLRTSMAVIGSWILVNTKLRIDASVNPVTARIRRAIDTLFGHAA